MARRIIFTSLVLLIVGAIINILVAWTCVAVSKSRMFNARVLGQLRTAQYDEEERLMKAGAPPGARYLAMLFDSPGTQIVMIDDEDDQSPQPIRTTRHDAGWPALSMRAEQTPGPDGKPVTSAGAMMGTLDLEFPSLPMGFAAPPVAPPPKSSARQFNAPPAPAAPLTAPVARRQKTDHLLPLRPIWPGFAINAVVFAAMACLCWLLFTMSMQTQRRFRGLCGRCAYPIGVSPVCTECGRKVRVRPVPRG